MATGSNDPSKLQRREFLQAGTVVTASAMAVGTGSPSLGDESKASKPTLPTRKLGKTGVDVSILNQGTWRAPGLDRLLRFSYANGVRYYDTAKVYGSEPGIAKWFDAMPEVRKSIFLVSKDTTRTKGDATRTAAMLPAMLDERLAELKTDYLDLFFIHGLGDYHTTDQAVQLVKSKELKETFDAIRKSGKARFVGFSTHHQDRAQIIQAAAEGGFTDAIMVQYTPWMPKDHPLNKALDAAHKAGIGLISMKQIAAPDPSVFLAEVPKHAPELIAKGLKPVPGPAPLDLDG